MFDAINMDFRSVCRTCLDQNNLFPIFTSPEQHRKCALIVFLTTGVKIAHNDGLPQRMCKSCINCINESVEFRKRCRDTELKLLDLKDEFVETKIDINNYTVDNELPILGNNVIKTEIDDTAFLSEENSGLDNEEFTKHSDTSSDDDRPLKELLSSTRLDRLTEESLNAKKLRRRKAKLNLDDSKNKVDIAVVDLKQETPNYYGMEKREPEKSMKYKTERVTCKLCQQNLSVRSIDSHMARRHPGADESKTKCEFCDTYVRMDKMNRHRILMHGSQFLKCIYCKTEFPSKDTLKEHVSECTAKKRKRKANESSRKLLECDICHKVMQKASLRLHKLIKHDKLGPVCEHCGKRFGNNFRLNEHYRARHGYEKFKCSYCEFQSASAMSIRNHERRHRGEKPYVCETCGAKFHASYLLTQHRQSHRTQKLFKCDLCPASFKANNNLHMHKLTCHSTTVYRCSLCPRSYSCRHYAVKHLRHVHRLRGPIPPLQAVEAYKG